MRKRKHPVETFQGVSYYRKPSGYYKADHTVGGAYLHRDVWEHHNGPIPEKHHVHHVDGDKRNNDIGNLQLLSAADHASHHGRERFAADPDGSRKHMRETVVPASAAWHASPEGIEWHRKHGAETWDGREPSELVCTHCEQHFFGFPEMSKRGFCSAKCQSAARRASGVDNETRSCLGCGCDVVVNKYAKTRYCCISCGAAHRRSLLDNGVRPDGGG